MSIFLGLEHIGLLTDDVEVSKAFYINNLGFTFLYEKKVTLPDNNYLMMSFISLNDLTIELLSFSDKTMNKSGNAGAVDHVNIAVSDLKAAQSQLESEGIVFETKKPRQIENNANGGQINFFRGPSNERIELSEKY